MSRSLIVILFVTILFQSCDNGMDSVTYIEEPVVNGLLRVGEGIEEFRLTRTLPLDVAYDSVKAGIEGAVIRITDEFGEEVTLKPVADRPGVYEAPQYIIKPKVRYFLNIAYNGKQIQAETTTPDTFTLAQMPQSRYVYLKEEIRIRWSSSEGAAAYYFTVTSIDHHPKKIERRFSEQNPYSERRTRFFWTKDTSTVLFSWLHNYYGLHEVSVYAIDENLYRYLRSFVQQSQELNEPDYPIENAIGYFGSAVVRSQRYELRHQ